MDDIELPDRPPAGASDFGLAMHYGNALMFEMLKRKASPDRVRECALWYAAMFANSPEATVDALVDEFRLKLERIRAGRQ